MRRFLLMALVWLTLTGCSMVGDYTFARRSAIDAQIAAARVETTSHLNALNDQQLALLKQSIVAHEGREQSAADYLFKSVAVLGGIKQLSRPEMVINQSVQQTVAVLPPASATAQAKAFQDLKIELDETKVSNEALKVQYEAELSQARSEGVAKDKALTDIAVKLKIVDEERVTVLAKANATEVALGDKRKELADKTIADKTREVEEAKSVQAIKLKLSSIAGGLGLLFLLGAIYSPVFKQQLGLAAGVLLLTAAAIWYIQAWMLGVVIGVVLVGLIGWMAKNHYIESRAATGVFRAIQSVKDTAKDDYDRVLKPKLTEWLTTYHPKTGDPIPDTIAIDHIDKRLQDVGDK